MRQPSSVSLVSCWCALFLSSAKAHVRAAADVGAARLCAVIYDEEGLPAFVVVVVDIEAVRERPTWQHSAMVSLM